jgi:hypothetical protein
MLGLAKEKPRKRRSDGNSQHHIGVLEQDAPLAAGVNAKPSAGIARR